MKAALLLVVVALTTIGCTDGSSPSSDPGTTPPEQTAQASDPRTSPSAETAQDAPSRKADIYAAVIRQLGSERSLARSEVIYVVDGEIVGAGDPRGDPFGPAPQGFGQDVVAGIRQQVADELPPLRFVDDGTEALRRPDRPGRVKNRGVLISLGPIETTKGRVHVPNTLWCGGKCSQWQTYVLSQRNGRWAITGTSGPVVGS